MSTKTVKFTKQGIGKLPTDRPVVYKILTAGNRNIYTGVAKRGRVQERLMEHKTDGMSGAKVQISQKKNISEAREIEDRIIARSKPKYNDKGK